MGLDIWFKDDLANIVRAANEANLSAMLVGDWGYPVAGSGDAGRELRRAYRRGFVAALATLAQALGLPVTEMDRELTAAAPENRLDGSSRLALPASGIGGRQCEK